MIALHLASASVVALAPAFDDVITVDDSGGADFVVLADAVAAAQPGDTVLVSTGTYEGFVLTTGDVSIVAGDGELVDVLSGVYVFSVPAGSSVQLAGLRVQGSQGQSALTVTGCEGAVVVDDCLFIGAPVGSAEPPSAPAGAIGSSAKVAISDSSFFGTDGTPDPSSSDGSPALEVTGSGLHLSDVTLDGGRGANASGDLSAGSGADALIAITSKVVVQGSAIAGGDGGNGQPLAPSCTGGDGGPAITSIFTELNYRDCALVAGVGGAGSTIGGCADGATPVSIEITGAASIVLPGQARAIDAGPQPRSRGRPDPGRVRRRTG